MYWNTMARFEMRTNSELEGWDVIDTQSLSNEGGDCRDVPEPHWVATFYDEVYANLFIRVANALSED
jgi:hypothetical protein